MTLNVGVGRPDTQHMAEVLLVDDDPDVRAMLAITLEDDGHTVREAGDGLQALAALEEKVPDCVVLDVMMPALDGFGVLREMRRRELATEARVLLLTCKAEEQDFVRGWELGADEYLTKPFDPDLLLKKVEALLTASPEELQNRRENELQKAELLDRLESAFSRSRRRVTA